jgi:hypothetical protein
LTIPPYLLLESTGTNLFLQSQTLNNSPWVKSGTTVSSVTDSDLSWQTNRITATATTFPRVQQIIALDAGSTYAFSILVKAGSVGFMHGTVDSSSNSQTLRFYANLTTGATSQGTSQGTISATSSRKLISGGYYLYTWVIAVSSTENHTTFFGPSSAYQSSSAAVNDYIDVGYAQIELGSYATSAIPTTTAQVTRAADTSTSAQVTRAADSALMTGVNFSSWYSQSEGTVYFESRTGQDANGYAFSLFGSNTQNRIFANYASLSRVESGTRRDGVFSSSITSQNTAPLNTLGKGASAYKVGSNAFSWNGAAVLTSSPESLPTPVLLSIGSNNGLVGNYLNGTIKKLAFYPKRLSNIELVGLTA